MRIGIIDLLPSIPRRWCVSHLAFLAVIKTTTESGLRRKGLFGLHVWITVRPEGKPRQKLKYVRYLEARIEAEITENTN